MAHTPTIFVTGATDGLGRALAEHLATKGSRLILHGRNEDKLSEVAEAISKADGAEPPTTVVADLSDLAQVKKLAREVAGATERLDVFVSNAGIGSGLPEGRTRATSKDGYELRFAVNYLAGFSLTLDLLELLRRSAPARVVYVASIGQYPIDFDDLMLEDHYRGDRAYGQSKLAQIMSGFELAERLPVDDVTVNSLHPGTYMPTKIVLEEIGSPVDSLETGVRSVARLVSDPSLRSVSGKFFDRTREARANAQAYDQSARRELWRRSLELVGRMDFAQS
jgi:NAD(P)-dependent dehydrogenase (short-subunit alcohol dehydrogenase family)